MTIKVQIQVPKSRLARLNVYQIALASILSLNVTRFCEISPLWQHLQSLRRFKKAYLVFGKIMSLLWQLFYALRQIYIVANSQILINSLAIWSHCSLSLNDAINKVRKRNDGLKNRHRYALHNRTTLGKLKESKRQKGKKLWSQCSCSLLVVKGR